MKLRRGVTRTLGPALSSLLTSLALGAEVAPLTLETVAPEPGRELREFFSLEVQFSEPVQGVDAADLLLNGQAATNVTEVAPGLFLFTFPQPSEGLVAVSWSPDHAITDQATGLQVFAGGSWSYTLDTTSPAPGVLLSEFVADNKRTLNDENGESSDWIEIYNSGETEAILEGWYLTDSPTNLTKWRFPEVSLAAGGYLVVFASEKNRTNATGRLHTNFKLPKEGQYLALVSPRTNVVSEFAPAYPKQFTDTSYGRTQGDPNVLGYFVKPTPGAPNTASGPGFASDVLFSHASGPFTDPFELLLWTSSNNALIRYTLDGTLPTNSSPVYLGPIPITNSMQVRARAYQEGLLPGAPRSQYYLMLSNNVLSFTSDLPVLVINTMSRTAPNASRTTFANLAFYEPVAGATSLTNPPVQSLRAGVRIRGSSTEGYGKSSFAVELWDEFNVDQPASLLGLPEESDWVLYAPNNFEPVLIHNPFIHQLSRDLGQYSPRTRFVEVYLNKTGGIVASNSYNGIYVLEEKIKIGKNRVAIDELEPEHVAPPEVTGGYLLKIDRLDPGDTGFSAGGQNVAYVDPKEKEIRLLQRRPQQNYIRDYFNAFTKALNGTNSTHPTLGYAPYIDLDAWIDFHVVEVLSGNVDALVLSTYFHKPRNGRIVFGPHWDFDRALGSTDGRDANPRNWTTGPFFTGWWSRVLRDPYAWQKWVDRWQDLRRSHFANTKINALIDRFANEVRAAQPREQRKWRVALRGGSYQSEVNLMKNWLSNRMDFIDKQLAPRPELSSPGGLIPAGFVLTMSLPPAATNATIYYTLDGADPRLRQGDLSPLALPYTGPVTLATNARVVARSHDPTVRQRSGPPISTPWSSPVAATFVVTTPSLLITEIMFHPEPPSAGSANTAGDFEFIELKNVGAATLDLLGCRLTNGIDFTFWTNSAVTNLAPGGRALVVKNLAAFLTRYPAATNIAGEFQGSLSNGGNRLTLFGPLLEPITDFAYDDAWARLADGAGFSLVLADESTPPDRLGEAARWRLSARPGGSPAQADPPPLPVSPVFINEALTHTDLPQVDAIELYNPGPFSADLSGWFLTDDFRNPKKYRFPDHVGIPAQGFAVLLESDLRAGPIGFGLSALGDEVYLFSADPRGALTGYFHGFGFGAAENGVSFGRYVTSDGREHFVPQQRLTLDGLNAGPRVGPVVVGEIMYEPPPNGTNNNTADEFIELHNLSALPTPLFDPAHPANTWRLRGGVDFDFPPALTLPPHGYLLIVGFDPVAAPASLAAFRARYSLDPATPVLGPWQGRLDNAGDHLRLLKPTPPEPAATDAVPYVLVEEIAYAGSAFWPTNAAGAGLSLQRRPMPGFGDEPQHWFADQPSPGADGPNGDTDGDGLTNAQEALAGTNPHDPFSGLRLAVETLPGGGITLSFTAMPGHAYQLLYRDSLLDGDWRLLRAFDPPPAPVPASFTDTSAAPTRFYRLLTP